MEWGYVAALIAGLTIEAFFKLVKYRDSLNRQGPVSKYEPINYASVSQYLSGVTPNDHPPQAAHQMTSRQ